jgi:hypothetical protein
MKSGTPPWQHSVKLQRTGEKLQYTALTKPSLGGGLGNKP